MKVLILSGPPGAGKSTYVKTLQERGLKVEVCSADDWFVDPETGEYKFDPNQLDKAHTSCMGKFLFFLNLPLEEKDKIDYLIIDNTNTQLWEITPYTSVASAKGYNFKIVKFFVDPEVCANRNIHGVPKNKVLKMAEKLKKLNLPKSWEVETVRE